jgi:hypothetical protein
MFSELSNLLASTTAARGFLECRCTWEAFPECNTRIRVFRVSSHGKGVFPES